MNYQNPLIKAASAERFHKSNEFIKIAKIVAAAGGQKLEERELARKYSALIKTIYEKAAANAMVVNGSIAEYSDVVSAFRGSLINSAFEILLEASQRVPLHSRVAIVTGGMVAATVGEGMMSWSRLSEQNLRVDKWSICRG
jgi:hypothetical protein